MGLCRGVEAIAVKLYLNRRLHAVLPSSLYVISLHSNLQQVILFFVRPTAQLLNDSEHFEKDGW